MSVSSRDIGRLVFDLVADVDIRRVPLVRVKELFGRNAVAGIIENSSNCTIYIGKGQSHADTVRCLLHELAHYYVAKYEVVPLKEHEAAVKLM
jgi:hypothetical protein